MGPAAGEVSELLAVEANEVLGNETVAQSNAVDRAIIQLRTQLSYARFSAGAARRAEINRIASPRIV